jgi:8-amino-7-oxononanoate synthase
MDMFEKCRRFYYEADYARSLGYPSNPRMAQALGLYPFFIPMDKPEGTEFIYEEKRYIMIGSNNYLGLTVHPKLKEAAIKAIEKYGTSCTGSRFLNGTLQLHLELEDRLAAFTGKESALVFATGYQANLGTISSILGKGDIVILDKDVHASIVDGLSLAKANKTLEVRFFRHNDMHSLEGILKSYPDENQGKLVIVDGVFSMFGDIAPLPDISNLCEKYQAHLMVDDAHSLGVLGKGHGTPAHFNCTNKVDLIMGTFSKSLASVGGFIAGKKEVIHWIQHIARPFIFSASLPPANLATVLAALDIIDEEPERINKVNEIGSTIRERLKCMGYDVGNSQTPIIPIIVGDQFKTMQAWDQLFRNGIYANVALPPAVKARRSLLRTSYMATHTDEQIEKVLSVFEKVREIMPH